MFFVVLLEITQGRYILLLDIFSITLLWYLLTDLDEEEEIFTGDVVTRFILFLEITYLVSCPGFIRF